ncbi:MAG TPA: M23 family metallopeptidase [Anaerolineales bacterium]|nr:M23 family metallopeptidase [Anaerolineales bacterium]
MPENQIILLPKQNYYEWVAAARDYVLKFGPNITPDPQTAAAYYAPTQVITIANSPDGYGRDIVQWFKDNHPGLRLDVVNVNAPNDFKNTLAARIANNMQFAADGAPFKLRWPTDYPKISQPFGVNADVYRRFGLPGHEGLDIRAPMNSNVYAAADGTVSMVNNGTKTDGTQHPYGIHIRIQHRDGYQTIYAHLMKANATEGQQVRAGDLIGLADSTGNSTGSHLHLTLKKQGASAAGQTNFPNDVIDPTPFLEGAVAPPADSFGWPPRICLVGVNGRSDGPLMETDYPVIQQSRVEAVKLLSSARPENVDRLRQIDPDMFIMVRLFADFKNRRVRSDEFASWVEGDMANFYAKGIRYYEVHNEPNLQIEGWKFSWQDGKEFGRWMMDVIARLKAKFPEAKFGYPGLSPGASISGQRVDSWAFLGQGDEAARAVDFMCCHCYWVNDADQVSPTGGLVYEEYRKRYPNKLLFITEFSNPTDNTDTRAKGNQYVNYYKRLRNLSGLGAAFSFVLSGSSGFPHEVWRLENGTVTEIPKAVGARSF